MKQFKNVKIHAKHYICKVKADSQQNVEDL